MTLQIKINLSPTYSRGGVGATVKACSDIIERAYQRAMREDAERQRIMTETRAMTRKAEPVLTKEHAERRERDRSKPNTNRTKAVIARRTGILATLTGRGWVRMTTIRAEQQACKGVLAADMNWLLDLKMIEERRVLEKGRTYIEVRATE